MAIPEGTQANKKIHLNACYFCAKTLFKSKCSLKHIYDFFFFLAAPGAYGSFQTKDRIQATAAARLDPEPAVPVGMPMIVVFRSFSDNSNISVISVLSSVNYLLLLKLRFSWFLALHVTLNYILDTWGIML